ncbi:hypothetical protein MY9_3716 [Bacillus sp. JS]|nr:hypothetical protein MY9_3716 [Bacillus sp. JS]
MTSNVRKLYMKWKADNIERGAGYEIKRESAAIQQVEQ